MGRRRGSIQGCGLRIGSLRKWPDELDGGVSAPLPIHTQAEGLVADREQGKERDLGIGLFFSVNPQAFGETGASLGNSMSFDQAVPVPVA